MAPPSPRRPGFSRRAQFGLFSGYVVAVIGALVGLLLLVTARLDPAGHSAIQGFLADIFSPVSSAGRSFVHGGQTATENVGAYFDAASKNQAMSAELKAMHTRVIKGDADALENARLKAMLRLVEAEPGPHITARIISSTGSSSRRYATLGAGTRQGVRTGQPVRGPDGLIGRVIHAGLIASQILLISDAENVVPAKRASDGIPALIVGTGIGMLELRPLGAGSNPFRPGDVFVTSGTGGIYRPGIPVAIAVRQDRDISIARPLANPATLDFAIVEPEYLPPIPPPPPAPLAATAPKAK